MTLVNARFYAPLRIFTALFIVAFTFLSAAQAYAQTVSPDGAAKLKDHLQKTIKMHSDVKKLAGDTYEWTGDLTVEPSNTYYAVTLPYLKIKQATGSRMDIGMIAVNAIPSTQEGHWKVAVAVPTPIRVYDKLGSLDAEIAIGSQRMAGIWVEAAMNFLKLDGVYENIVVSNSQNAQILQAPKVTLRNDFEVTGEQLWSGPYSVTADNVTFNIPEEKVKGSIAQAYLTGDVKNFKISSLSDFQEKIQEVSGKIDQSVASGAPLDDQTKEQIGKMSSAMFDYLTDFSDSSNTAFGVKGIEVEFPSPTQDDQIETVKMGQLGLDFSLADMTEASATLGFGISLLGIDAGDNAALSGQDAPKTEFYTIYIPDTFTLSFLLEKFPYKQMMGSLGKASVDIINTEGNVDSNQATTDILNAQMPNMKNLMTSLGTVIKLKNAAKSSDLYQIDLDTNLTASAVSPLMVVGTANLRIQGLDAVIGRLTQDAQTATPEQAGQIQQALGGIGMMQMLGQQQQDPTTGKIAHVYVFDFKESGQILLNGADMSALTGAAGQAPAPAQPVQPAQ